MRCPYCGSVVEPVRDVHGALVCPACRNTGQVFAVPLQAWTPVAAPPFASAAPPFGMAFPQPGVTPPLAIVSLVLGVGALFLLVTVFFAPLAVVFGGVAIGLGIPALRSGRQPPVSGTGRGLAIGGIAAGSLGVAFGLFAAVFLGTGLLDDLGAGPAPSIQFDLDGAGSGGVITVVDVEPHLDWEEFEVSGSAVCSAPSGPVEVGDRILCEVDGRVEVFHWPSGEVVYASMV